MNKFKKKFALIILITLIIIGTSAHNYAFAETKNEPQTWDAIVIEGAIHNNIRGYLDIQPRIGTITSEMVVRPALGYQLNDACTIWQGYSWQPRLKPQFIDENRLYQQVLYRKNFNKLHLTFRSRTEERFIENLPAPIIRQRELLKLIYPISKDGKWKIFASNEIFINYNSPGKNVIAGVEQARFYYGIMKNINKFVNIEIGYMFDPTWGRHNNLFRHNILFTISINTDVKGIRHYPEVE